MNNKEQFEQHWEYFITAFRGKLLTQSKKQALSYPLVNLLFSNEVSSWGSEYELNGRWLNQFASNNPEKGKLIRDILLNDMSLTEIKMKGEISTSVSYIIPITGAIVGLGISRYLGAGMLVQSASTILPALALYPAVKTFCERKKQNTITEVITEYINQLDKYKFGIESILNG